MAAVPSSDTQSHKTTATSFCDEVVMLIEQEPVASQLVLLPAPSRAKDDCAEDLVPTRDKDDNNRIARTIAVEISLLFTSSSSLFAVMQLRQSHSGTRRHQDPSSQAGRRVLS